MTDKKQGGAVVSSLSDTRGQKTVWLQLSASRHDELAAAQAKLGLDLSVKRGRAAAEEAGFILIPVEMVIRQGQQYRCRSDHRQRARYRNRVGILSSCGAGCFFQSAMVRVTIRSWSPQPAGPNHFRTYTAIR